MMALLDEFSAMSRTQRVQRAGEFKHRLVKLKRKALSYAGAGGAATKRFRIRPTG